MKKIAVLLILVLSLTLTLSAVHADDGVLTLPADLITIEAEAFRGNIAANKVVVQSGAETVGASAFEDGSFSDIRLPNTITEIGAGAFRNCGKATDPLKYYCIPAGINVGTEAFTGCRANIYINNNLIPYFKYTVGDTGVTITGLYGSYAIQEAVIPDTIEGKPVTAIANRAFDGNRTLARVTIPATVTSIGDSAFQNCSALAEAQLPAGLTSIGTQAFLNCNLTGTLTIPAGITTIGKDTFSGNRNLQKAVLPEGLQTIGENAFYDCYGMEQVNIPSTVTEIGIRAFAHNESLTAVIIPTGINALPKDLFYGCKSLVSAQLPAGLTAIGEGTFMNCTKLTSVNIPAGLTAIGTSAFENACANQPGNNIYELPASLTTIGNNAFYKCGAGLCVVRGSEQETMMRDRGLTFTYHGGHDFRYLYSNSTENGETVWTLKLTGYLGAGGNVAIPEGPTVIAERAFYGNTAITGVTIPTGVTTIEKWAFQNCSELATLVMPDTLTTVLDTAFRSCTKLTDVTFSRNLTTLNGNVFEDACRGQAGIHYFNLPAGLTTFNSYTFYNCDAVLCVGHNTSAEATMLTTNYIFTYTDQLDLRYKKDGQKRCLWGYTGNQSPIILPDDCEAVRYAGFSDLVAGGLICTPLSVTDEALSAAGLNHTFPGHEDYRYRVISEKLYLMGYAGNGTQLDIPEATEYIQAGWDEQIYEKAFKDLAAITMVSIPEGVTRINPDAFANCFMLSDIRLPDTLASMGTNVFGYCGRDAAVQPLTLTLPDTLVDIVGRGGGTTTFSDFNAVLLCGKTSRTAELLTDRNYVYTVAGEEDFRYRYEEYTDGEVTGRRLWLVGYTGISPIVDIPGGIYGIKRYQSNTTSTYYRTFYGDAFYGRDDLTKVVIPDGTAVIGNSAFMGCTYLTDITFPSTLDTLEDHALEQCGKAVQTLHYYFLPDNITHIGVNINAGWGSFTDINMGRIVCAVGSRTAIVLSDAESRWQAGYQFALKGHHTDGLLYKYEYWEDEEGTVLPRLILKQYEGNSSELDIPSGCGIVRIEPNVFKNHTELERVTIPEGITEIGNDAFNGCTMLHLGARVEAPSMIDGQTIYGSAIILPESLKTLGERAFKDAGSGYSGADMRFFLVFSAGLETMSTNSIENCNFIMVSPERSLDGTEQSTAETILVNNWYIHYHTLENALRQENVHRRYHEDYGYNYPGYLGRM